MMNIRLFKKDDLDAVSSIENLCFNDGRYNNDQILYEYNNELTKFYVCEIDKKIVGFIIFMITFNSSTIVQIATHPDFQHKGVATALLNQMLTDISNLGYGEVETITLEVRKQNKIAKEFYLKNAFKEVLVKPKYYSNGDDAIYMMRILL